MMKKKLLGKVISTLVLFSLIVSAMSVFSFAKNVNLSGYKVYKSAKCTTFMQGTMKSHFNSVSFQGHTGGAYKGTSTPTKIVHSDIIKTTGIGSVSVSGTAKPTTAISGKTWTEKYSVSKKKKVDVYPTYNCSASLATFWVRITSSTKYQFGSTFITTACGDQVTISN